jgi:hypothetical protein
MDIWILSVGDVLPVRRPGAADREIGLVDSPDRRVRRGGEAARSPDDAAVPGADALKSWHAVGRDRPLAVLPRGAVPRGDAALAGADTADLALQGEGDADGGAEREGDSRLLAVADRRETA